MKRSGSLGSAQLSVPHLVGPLTFSPTSCKLPRLQAFKTRKTIRAPYPWIYTVYRGNAMPPQRLLKLGIGRQCILTNIAAALPFYMALLCKPLSCKP